MKFLMRMLVFLNVFLWGISLFSKPLVVSTNTILQDFLSQLAPDSIRVQCVMPPDADAHFYEPSPKDVRMLSKADLIIVNGLDLEPQIMKVIKNSGFKGRLLIASTGVSPLHGACKHAHQGHHHHHLDPHAWLDLSNVEIYIRNISDALIELTPQDTSAIREKTDSYLKQIRNLDQYVRRELACIPEENRKLVLTHDSFAYFARAYGFANIPISGVNPDQEPNARQLAQIIDLIRKEKVKAIFTESSINPKLAKLIATETKVMLVPSLITDRIPSGKSFMEVYRDNVDAIAKALTR